ncbi:MAG: hypothetical protein RLZZ241_624 [Bacteroidota bacterium]|jgi:microcystin-dependent protein
MKNFIKTSVVAFLILLINHAQAQTNVTSSGLSIQGIARDENNSALANFDQLELVFTIYYLGAGNSEQLILTKTANVTTDNFGVFSYVLVIDQLQYNLISNNSAYLKVTQGSVVFSNEKLQAVPYSIYAQNGVPTGAIMPFIGTVAPTGWLLCDGSAIPNNQYTANLIALLGSANTPNLNGMFLRGTGTHATGQSGPSLMAVQQDSYESHVHSLTNVPTSSNGNHNHPFSITVNLDAMNGGNKGNVWRDLTGTTAVNGTTSSAGAHTHTVSGNSDSSGDTETRPVNYGVHYIIKI